MRIAIIGPKFFGYSEAIAEEFQKMKIFCKYFDELPSNDLFTKSLVRITNKNFVRSFYSNFYKNLIREINALEFDLLFVISPETIDHSILRKINVKRKILYLWDNLKNKSENERNLYSFDKIYSFDVTDCQNYGFDYLHLFAEDIFKSNINDHHNKEIDLLFFGSVHSQRLKILDVIKDLKIKKYIYLYSPNLLISSARCGLLNSIKSKNHINNVPLTKLQISCLMSKSKIVLDNSWGNQFGFSSRTFESLYSGYKIITNQQIEFPYPIFEDNIIRYENLMDLEAKIISSLDNYERNPKSESDNKKLSLSHFCELILRKNYDL